MLILLFITNLSVVFNFPQKNKSKSVPYSVIYLRNFIEYQGSVYKEDEEGKLHPLPFRP